MAMRTRALLVSLTIASNVAMADVQAKITTTKGVIVAKLFDTQVPMTVGNFVTLARQGFYDGTLFHRVVANYLVQGGDPLGTGAGGPGYCFADEIVPELKLAKAGMLAMANTGPQTNGSQFFFTLAPAPNLDGKHTVFGEVVEGLDVLTAIGLAKTKSSKPEDDIKVMKVDIVGDFTPPKLEKVRELKDAELEAVLKAPVEDLFEKVGASLGYGKLLGMRFEKGRRKCGEGQVSYVADYASHKGARMLIFGKSTASGFAIQQFQFGKSF